MGFTGRNLLLKKAIPTEYKYSGLVAPSRYTAENKRVPYCNPARMHCFCNAFSQATAYYLCIRVLYIQRNMYIISVGCTVSAYGRALLSCTRFSNITYVELEFRERTVIVDPSEAGISRETRNDISSKKVGAECCVS